MGTSLFDRLGATLYDRRRRVLAGALVVLIATTAWGIGLFGSLNSGGFYDPSSESSRAAEAIAASSTRPATDVIVLYRTTDGGRIDTPAHLGAIAQTIAALPTTAVVDSVSYASTKSPALLSGDGQSTYVGLALSGVDDQSRETSYKLIVDSLVAAGLEMLRGGAVAIAHDVNAQVGKDIGKAEGLSIPILIILLIVVFGSLVAASLPMAIGVFAIMGAFASLHVVSLFGDVSVYSVNIVTMLGLGLAIDYALFVVSRFREQLREGDQVRDAVIATVRTAGRTVVFSAVTVALSLSTLLLFPQNFLRSMGAGGIFAVVFAVLAAVTVLPALLAVLGHRVNSLRVPLPWSNATSHTDPDAGAWARIARGVMRRPVAVATVAVVVLLVLGSPFLKIAFGGVDTRVLPATAEGRVATESLQRDFDLGGTTIDIALQGFVDQAGAAAYTLQLERLSGVEKASVVGSTPTLTHVSVRYAGEASSQDARALVANVRATAPPAGTTTLVGGDSAALVDLLQGLRDRLPWVAALLGIAMFLLLFLAFGSVVLPLKAIVMNILSLSATFGVLVWGFQDGHLSGALNFTSTGFLEATQPILIFAIAFGLSMDYEVFLLSRMREEWDATGDNTLAVTRGLQRTGGIITGAALLFVVVVAAFATSGIVFIAMIGVGLTVAVIVDATLVRALLVPATMRLLGHWNWYAPAPLARWWDRYGVRESEPVTPDRVLVG